MNNNESFLASFSKSIYIPHKAFSPLIEMTFLEVSPEK